jgi:arylsulfatase A-like enzyme
LFILTDNQGPWSLGCYGNRDIYTPHLDRLASEGALFTQAFANNPVCSPTRATWLTGWTPSRHGVHRYLSPELFQGAKAYDTLRECETLQEMFAASGYYQGWIGKCHLGDHLHSRRGVDFWNVKLGGHTTSFLHEQVIEGGVVREHPGHVTHYWTENAVRFLEGAAKQEKPFFLFLAYNGPYGLQRCVTEPAPEPWASYYRDRPMTDWPRPTAAHPTQRSDRNHIGNLQVMRNLAGQISAVDEGVGVVLEQLERLQLAEETLVVFTSDQGAVAGHAGFWGMGDHASPNHLRDGTLRVPLIVRWPGKVRPGSRESIVANYDFVPTLRSLLSLSARQPIEELPGRDWSRLLLQEEPLEEDILFAEFELTRGVRTKEWKYVRRLAGGPERELYDLKGDPDELHNLALAPDAAQQAIMRQLDTRLQGWFAKHSSAAWDLWNGGNSQGKVTGELRKFLEAKQPKPRMKAVLP